MAKARSHAQASLAPLSTITSLTNQFPLPPPSPLSAPLSPTPRPPMTGPPKQPLPSIPGGPSRFSDHEAVLLLSSSSSIHSRLSIASRKSSDSFGASSRYSGNSGKDEETDPVLPATDVGSLSQHSNTSKDLISSVEFPGETEDGEDLPTTTPDAPPAIDAQALHRHIRSARSRSNSHKRALQQWKTPGRPTSPDIDSIITQTPRPKRGRSFSNLSSASASSSRSKSRGKPQNSLNGSRRTSEGNISTRSRKTSGGHPRVSKAFSDRSWAEDDFIEDYGTFNSRSSRIDGLPYDQPEMFDEAAIQKLEEQLEGGSGSDSDSSIDLHTPLPNLMVRHGLLSPRSKLLAGPSRPASSASFASNASVVTKSGIIKDQRDTPQRRTRHRDGKQLRGGLGLTTGLGWSDSEDEDAPSALTKRISHLNLSRASSMSSVRSKSSTRPSRASLDESRRKSAGSRASNSSRQSKTPSRSRTPGASASSVYTTSFHLPNRVASPTTSPRIPASLSTIGETQSIDTIITRGSHESSRRVVSDSSIDSAIFEPSVNRNSQSEDASSSSTISVPPPATPKDDIVRPPPSFPSTPSKSPASTISKLPSSGLRKPRSLAPIAEPTTRMRSVSSASALESQSKPPPMSPLPPVPTNNSNSNSTSTSALSKSLSAPRTPRPLQLLSQQGRSSLSAVGGDRTGPQVPRSASATMMNTAAIRESSLLPASFNMVSAPNTPTKIDPSPNTSGGRPKPRTGTGMVYRSSSISKRQNAGSDGGGSTISVPATGTRMRTPSTTRQKPVPI